MIDYLKNLSTETKAMLCVLSLLIVSLVMSWYDVPQPTNRKPTLVPSAPSVEDVPVDTVPAKKVKVLRKKELGKKVPLPPEVSENENKQVTAVVDLPPSRGGTQVMAVTDVEEGSTQIYAKEKPLPLIGFPNSKRIGAAYGTTTHGAPEIKVYGEYTFFRMGEVYLGVQAEVNSRPEAKAFVAVDYRF